MKRAVLILTCGLLLSTSVASGASGTQRGVVLAPSDLEAAQLKVLRRDVAAHRAAHPAVFSAVQGVLAQAAIQDKRRRGRFASLTRALDALGPDALLPMLEQLALQGVERGPLTPTAWLAVRVSLIESVGRKRDVRAVPVLSRIAVKNQEYWVVRAAAEALGRIGNPDATQLLVSMATTPGEKRRAVLSAIGDCRRPVIVSTLDGLLRGKLEYEERRLALAALGDVGNAWAWETPELKQRGEASVVRSGAAHALVQAFVRHHADATLAREIQKSLLVVEDPSTPDRIEGAKQGADKLLAQRLDALKQKYVGFMARKRR
jgi:hypothetical protein